jgi:hypothetical protein
MDEYWSRHFSLTNGLDSGSSDDLPMLLRRVADTIEAEQIQPMEILDLTVHSDITAEGPCWSVSVYWSPGNDE